MPDHAPFPPNLQADMRLLQRHVFRFEPLVREDGEMRPGDLETFDRNFPPDKGRPTFSTLWKNYCRAVENRTSLSGMRGLSLLEENRLQQKCVQAEMDLAVRVLEIKRNLTLALNDRLETLAGAIKIDDAAMRDMQDILNLHRKETFPIESTMPETRLALVPDMMNDLNISWHKVSDAWRNQVPMLRQAITTDGVAALDSGLPVGGTENEPYVVHYSFTAHEMPEGFDLRKKTGTCNTKDLGDFNRAERDAFRQALLEYSTLGPIRFVEVENAKFPADAKNCWRIFASYIDDKETIAFSHFPPKDVSARYVGPMVFDRRFMLSDASFPRTLMHEIGHALGLKHPFGFKDAKDRILVRDHDESSMTVMAYEHKIGKDEYDGLRPLDIAVIQERFKAHGRVETNAGNTLYKLYENSPLRVIADSGGMDVLDASCRICPDSITVLDISGDIYDPIKKNAHVRVAQGTQIEKVIGTPNRDVIYSGSGKHRLIGNGGADTFVIPAAGTHVIEDFDTDDKLQLPNVEVWKSKIPREGLLQLHGVSLAGEPVDILVKTVGEETAKSLLKQLDIDRKQSTLPNPEMLRNATQAMGPALEKIQSWMREYSDTEEIAELKPGDLSRIQARPLCNETATRAKR